MCHKYSPSIQSGSRHILDNPSKARRAPVVAWNSSMPFTKPAPSEESQDGDDTIMLDADDGSCWPNAASSLEPGGRDGVEEHPGRC